MAYRMDRRRFLQSTGAGALALGVGLPLLSACGDDGGGSSASGSKKYGKQAERRCLVDRWVREVESLPR